MGDEVELLPADKHEIFLQYHSITLSVCSQICPKSAVSEGKREG